MSPNTVIVNVNATDDHNELVINRRIDALNTAIRCLQKMCAEEQGTFTITPNGWSFGFPKREAI